MRSLLDNPPRVSRVRIRIGSLGTTTGRVRALASIRVPTCGGSKSAPFGSQMAPDADAQVPDQSRARRLMRGVGGMLIFTAPVVLLGFAVRQQFDPVIDLDNSAITAATDVTRRHGLAPLLVTIQQVTQPVNVYLVTTLVAIWAAWVRKLKSRALWAFVTAMTGWMIGVGAKLVVERARPVVDDPVSHSPGYSFPSGHAINITVGMTVLLVLLWPLLTVTRRRIAVAAAVAAVLVVGLDRIFLGVHFPSDVIAGVVLGAGITFTSWIGFAGTTVATSSSGPSRPEQPSSPSSSESASR